jgi:polysaccharide export outer membrane protein
MINKILSCTCLLLIILLSACAPRRDLVYFSDLANTASVNDQPGQEIRIRQNDIVNVSMNSLSPESDALFASNKNVSADGTTKREGYRVNKSGMIHLPLIGDIKIEGMTIEEADITIATELTKHVKKPVVDVQIINFKITVIGEVNKPSSFIIPDEKVNVLEALGLAGDMTVYGKRERVLIIRSEGNSKTIKKLNLNNKEILSSPYFYLRQNDIVYVEPDRSKAVEYSQNTRLMPLITAAISALAVLTAVLLKR